MNRRRALLVGMVALTIAALVLVIVLSPTASLRESVPVFWIWFIAGVVNIVGAIVMALPTGLSVKEIKTRDPKLRHAVYLGMQSPWFWIGFWVSSVAWVVTTLAPLGLFFTLSAWSALWVFALNAIGNWLAIPLRIWIWGIHAQDEVPV
jgi:hypothetical protein